MDESIQERLREAAEAIKPKSPAWWVFRYADEAAAMYEQGTPVAYCPYCLRTPGQTRSECEAGHHPGLGKPVLYSPHQQGTEK